MIQDPNVKSGHLFVGIDLSLTSTGIAYVHRVSPDEVHRVAGVYSPPKAFRGVERLGWYRDHLIADIMNHALAPSGRDVLVVIEGYAAQAKYRAHQIGELGGVIRLALDESNIPFTVIAPTVLKKFVTGKGNSPKSLILKYLLSYFGADVDQEDAGDAMGLALYGAYLVGGYSYLTQARRESFKTAELPEDAEHLKPRVLPLEMAPRRRIRPLIGDRGLPAGS